MLNELDKMAMLESFKDKVNNLTEEAKSFVKSSDLKKSLWLLHRFPFLLV